MNLDQQAHTEKNEESSSQDSLGKYESPKLAVIRHRDHESGSPLPVEFCCQSSTNSGPTAS